MNSKTNNDRTDMCASIMLSLFLIVGGLFNEKYVFVIHGYFYG
jgi:hypothetical protein